MKSIVFKVFAVSIALGVAVFALAGSAGAAHVTVAVSVPDQSTAGGTDTLLVTLRSADQGVPLADAVVTLYGEASFGGVSSEVELGQTVTNENGVATVRFHPLFAGDHAVRVEYVAPGENEPEVVTTSVSLPGVTSQLYQSTAGVKIPGLNVWLLIAVVATVWAVLLSVAWRVIAIAHAGADAAAAEAAGGWRADAHAGSIQSG